ncbi:docking protein 2 [Tachyglossus aculeatus]|uniref:docking protein 2 n=1 Tax=Tachyglossus aculeatus TaxID=9261 RepID=UPI0018F4589A|nr:docking protein 2 [Tachyglossus aculeatus]XP_038602800.1 docking protein 2 [Tachyglossus aculeatus]XP_038602801.1 docking protein 2 [Tachyglossus aculeatus]XP_038602802.1 docking protein 2 [Tachyglossus aculeatus]
MDEAAVKQGFLYLQQQQTFGKKWKRFWAVLYGESGSSSARLELQEGSEKARRGEAARKVIRLSDCVRVVEAGGEAGSPRDTSPFLLETTERLSLLAAPSVERGDWIQAICHLAFPMQRAEWREAAGQESHSAQLRESPCMEENSLYSSSGAALPCQEFAVKVRQTDASERCRLRGSYVLRAGDSALELRRGSELGNQLYTWPYRFLRRFGRDKVTFSFEAGRRCASGEGSFEFETRKGNEIFLALEKAISAQKNSESSGPPVQPVLIPAPPRSESPYSRPHDSLPPPSATPVAPPQRSRPPEGDYAVPFDTVARSLMSNSFRGFLANCPQAPQPPKPSQPSPADPLYDSIDERLPLPDHIYDEPEGIATLTLYDRPQEAQGEAWRRQATAESLGEEGPQLSYKLKREDHALPSSGSHSGWPQRSEYDNVISRKGPR